MGHADCASRLPPAMCRIWGTELFRDGPFYSCVSLANNTHSETAMHAETTAAKTPTRIRSAVSLIYSFRQLNVCKLRQLPNFLKEPPPSIVQSPVHNRDDHIPREQNT